MEDGRGDRYHYDPEGQLDLASYRALLSEGWVASDAKRSDSFHYDELGNRAGPNYIASMGSMNILRRDNGLNQYKSWENNIPDPHHWGTGIFHDDNVDPFPSPPWVSPGNGVVMQDGYITGSFNALNQPVGIWSFAYQGTPNWMFFGYDPLGRCVKRWVGPHVGTPPNLQVPPANTNPATYLYYDGWNLVQEGAGGAAADRVYVHGGRVDEIVASQDAGGWRQHHYDARGHCILLTDGAGTILEQYDYDAFGRPYVYSAGGTVRTASSYNNRFLFTGREWLKDLKLYDYRNRIYQPELGRFLQPDPKQFGAGDYNLYRYCHNDPVNRSDPTGLTWADLMRWQGGGDGTVGEQSARVRIQQKAQAAIDHWAPWARTNTKEVAGTVKTNEEVTVGPEKDRHATSSNPGPITPDTAATWHLHLLLPKTLPYKFSEPKDSGFIARNPTLAHYVGVLNAPPGQFTIFAHTPEMPYMHFIRLGPQPFPQPPAD